MVQIPVTPTRYEEIGHGYANTRREDPHILSRILAALGDARTVVNVGAGAGSYEPPDRWVLAVEPSDVMAAQRPKRRAPALRADAKALPFRDDAFEGAMAILTIHHWDDNCELGVRELRRVASGPVVILTYDAEVSARMWLMADHLPEVVTMDRRIFPSTHQIVAWLGGRARIEAIPVRADCTDWMLGSFWAHPERVLDPAARAATSGFARMTPEVIDRVATAVAHELASGEWDRRYGFLRKLSEFDVGLRLIVAEK